MLRSILRVSKCSWKCCVLFSGFPNALVNTAFCSQSFQKLLEILRSVRRISKSNWKHSVCKVTKKIAYVISNACDFMFFSRKNFFSGSLRPLSPHNDLELNFELTHMVLIVLFFHLFGLCLRLLASVPETYNANRIVFDIIDHLAQTVNDDATISNEAVSK